MDIDPIIDKIQEVKNTGLDEAQTKEIASRIISLLKEYPLTYRQADSVLSLVSTALEDMKSYIRI